MLQISNPNQKKEEKKTQSKQIIAYKKLID